MKDALILFLREKEILGPTQTEFVVSYKDLTDEKAKAAWELTALIVEFCEEWERQNKI